MGLFEKHMSESNDKVYDEKEDTPAVTDSEELNTAGWDAITDAFEKIYPGQKEPLHYGTIISWRLGGNDPLEGISVYDGGDYWHFVTYGFSELYEKEFKDPEYSGYGFELTAKLKKISKDEDEMEIRTMCGILQSLGRMSYENGDVFLPEEYIYTGQTSGMDSKGLSEITGFITAEDEAGEINTPNGKVQFVQLIGMTDVELRRIIDKKCKVKDLLAALPDTLTDYNRDSMY